ncbi:hypothetical protein [Bifidobacterium catenulatum]|uniref:Lipoprotein n=1 Tax=Bifidobacterium catenulatum subsp. kashiwanohense TaxID=630129 RepID=A0AA43P4V0_9BIFI|nr:hypothetical protein [Bifidobacterium catenulatum]MDH7889061.1 hypothetical protein [Bifidobacterium catenulatum subsp. kashiwanohense]
MMFKRQETNLRRLLAMLLIPACLMCAGCEGAEGATRETKSDTSVSQSGETITDCKGYDYSRLRECRINLHDGRQVTCLILSGDIRSGMSCDWANATEETDN